MEDLTYDIGQSVLGGWVIKRKLGQGSIGQVYEIEKTQGGETIRSALKVISVPEDEEEITRVLSSGIKRDDLPQYYSRVMEDFLQEFRCMRQMKDSGNIVRYEEHLVRQHQDGIGWDILMRMEILTPLMEYALDTEITQDDVISLGIDISNALCSCEKQGIVHRDIKPDNIFVDENGTFKLGDFGVARIIEETQMSLSHKGTIAYMAPEVYRGEQYNRSADIYSLGLVMYKYLNNGRLPFMPTYPEKVDYDDSEKALVKRVRREDPPAPVNGSDELKKIVLKACSGNSEDRYQSAGELKNALLKLRNDSDAGSDTASAPHKAKTFIAAIAAVALAITAISVLALTPRKVTGIKGIDKDLTIYIGDAVRPEYVIEPKRFENEIIEFMSDDSEVFSVDDDGTINAASVGEAELWMEVRGYVQSVSIKVIPKVTDIRGIKNLKLTVGDKVKLKPVLEPEKFRNEMIEFVSSDGKVAEVTGEGEIRALSEGETKVKISSGGCVKKITVTVEEPAPSVKTPVPAVNYQSGSGTQSQSQPSKKSSSKKAKSSRKSSGGKKKSSGYFDSSQDEFFK